MLALTTTITVNSAEGKGGDYQPWETPTVPPNPGPQGHTHTQPVEALIRSKALQSHGRENYVSSASHHVTLQATPGPLQTLWLLSQNQSRAPEAPEGAAVPVLEAVRFTPSAVKAEASGCDSKLCHLLIGFSLLHPPFPSPPNQIPDLPDPLPNGSETLLLPLPRPLDFSGPPVISSRFHSFQALPSPTPQPAVPLISSSPISETSDSSHYSQKSPDVLHTSSFSSSLSGLASPTLHQASRV